MKIEATYVINLAASEDRWTSVSALLDRASPPSPRRWSGIDGATLGALERERLVSRGVLAADLSRFDPACRAGEIGCALSHRAVLEDVVATGCSTALVLEDDVALAGDVRDWPARFALATSEVPADAELWFLYRCLDLRHRVRRLTPRIVVPWMPQSAAAYAVTQAGAAILLAALTPLADAVDRIYRDLVRSRQVRAYAASPMLFRSGDHPSIVNRGVRGKTWVTNDVNRPPEYWPARFHRYLGEPRWRMLAASLWAAARRSE